MVGSPSLMSRSGLGALPDVREWSEVPSNCPEVVGRPSRISVSGRGPSQMSEVVGRPSLLNGSG